MKFSTILVFSLALCFSFSQAVKVQQMMQSQMTITDQTEKFNLTALMGKLKGIANAVHSVTENNPQLNNMVHGILNKTHLNGVAEFVHNKLEDGPAEQAAEIEAAIQFALFDKISALFHSSNSTTNATRADMGTDFQPWTPELSNKLAEILAEFSGEFS